ncbi:hypothetical protein M3Y97_00145700 [Aphelenchoides bicaudatus]|nr:hypothetical protein M3Y97_00145700 [Aphelenchoides bicaudatus]
MILNREEFTTVLLFFTVATFILACLVALCACMWSKFQFKRDRARSSSKSGQPPHSSSYNPLLQSSKSEPISLDIEYIDSADPNDQSLLVSSTTQVKTVDVSARP